jgi:hypothetical protein
MEHEFRSMVVDEPTAAVFLPSTVANVSDSVAIDEVLVRENPKLFRNKFA